MKTIIVLLMPVMTLITAMASSKMFAHAEYLSSAVLTIAAYLAASLWISVLSSKKLAAR
jgi:hypothetical protein